VRGRGQREVIRRNSEAGTRLGPADNPSDVSLLVSIQCQCGAISDELLASCARLSGCAAHAAPAGALLQVGPEPQHSTQKIIDGLPVLIISNTAAA
jgi:hypothetical protein